MMNWMITSSVLILIVLGLRQILKGKISLRLQYALWALVLLRLLLPWNPVESQISVLQLTRHPEIQTVMDSAREPIRFENQEIVVGENGESQRVSNTTFIADRDELNHLYSAEEIAIAVWKWGYALLLVFMLTSNVIFLRKLECRRKQIRVLGVTIPVYTTPAAETPCLVGFIHPSIYLPEQNWEEGQLRHVMEHEMTHYRHKDHIISVLRCIALALHWYNPLVWWAAKASKQDGELACDEGTIARLGEGERIPYGKTLLEMTCEGKIDRIMLTATAMYTGKKSLKERITRIAKKTRMAAITMIAVIAVMALAVGCTFTGVAETNPLDNLSDEELIQKLEQLGDPEEIEETLVDLIQCTKQYGVGIYERTDYGRRGRGCDLSEERVKMLSSVLAQYEWSRASENALLRDSAQWMELSLGAAGDSPWRIRLQCNPLDPELVWLSAYGLEEDGKITCAAEDILLRAKLQTEDPRTAENSSLYYVLCSLYGEQEGDLEQSREETMVSAGVDEEHWLPELLADCPHAMLVLPAKHSPTFAYQIRQDKIGVLAEALDQCDIVNDPDWNPPEGSRTIMISCPGMCSMIVYETAPYLYINVFENGESEERFAMLKVEPKDPNAQSIYEVAMQLYLEAVEGEYFDRTSDRIANTLHEALMDMGEEGCAEEMQRWRWIELLDQYYVQVYAKDVPAFVLGENGKEISLYDDQNLVKYTCDGEIFYYFALSEQWTDPEVSLFEAVYGHYLGKEEWAQWWMGADEPTDMTAEEMQECKVYLQWFDWTPIDWDQSMETAGENIMIAQGEETIEFFDGTNLVCYTSAAGSVYYSLTPKSDEIRPIWDIMLTMYDNRTQ